MESFRLYLESAGIYQLSQSLKKTYPGLYVYVSENDRRIHLHQIKVNPNYQGQGIGTKAIEAIQQYATIVGKPIILSPYPDRGKKSKLLKFYKSLGFKPNEGKDKDYSLSTYPDLGKGKPKFKPDKPSGKPNGTPIWVWRPKVSEAN